MSDLWVIARLKAAPGKEAALREALAALVAPTRREPGCVAYDLVVDSKDPTVFTFVERWDDHAALDAHLAAPHVTACLGAIGPLLAGAPDVRRCRLVP